VVGRVFWADAVSTVGGGDPLEHLHELVRMDFVRPARSSSIRDQLEYSFWHALVRDVAYANIAPEERWAKHRAAARWMEQHSATAEQAEILAGHYLRALDDAESAGNAGPDVIRELEDNAVKNLVASGEQAIQLEGAKAQAYFRRALELLPAEREERPTILAKAAETSYLLGDFPTAIADYEQVVN